MVTNSLRSCRPGILPFTLPSWGSGHLGQPVTPGVLVQVGRAQQWAQPGHSMELGARGALFHLPRRHLLYPGCHHKHSYFVPLVEAVSFALLRCDSHKD